jgi:hypothetical protein
MTEPTYGGLTAAQLWQAITEAECAEMNIKPLVLAALLREVGRKDDELDRYANWRYNVLDRYRDLHDTEL